MVTNLIIEDEEGSTTLVPLENNAITIGREEGNTIQLTEQNVSRHHARLSPTPDGWMIEDVHSYNGIKINGVDIKEPAYVREGDLIQIGDYRLALNDQGEHYTPAITVSEAISHHEPETEFQSDVLSTHGHEAKSPEASEVDDDFEDGNSGSRKSTLLWVIVILIVVAIAAILVSIYVF